VGRERQMDLKKEMIWSRLIAVSILWAGILPSSSCAQTYSLTGVRVQLLSGEVLTGRLARMSSDSLFIEMKGGKRRTVHYRSVDQVKMRRADGISNGIWIGAGSGLALGLVTGIALDDGGSSSSNGSYWSGLNQSTQSMEIAGMGLLGALAGATAGAIIGSQPKKIAIQGERRKYEELRTKCLTAFWEQSEKDKKKR
jgi:hypothetical protein